MAKYYIESYKKTEQSFLAELNTVGCGGVIVEPYVITLKKITFFGLFKTIVTEKVQLPKGFDHIKQLTKGREWKF